MQSETLVANIIRDICELPDYQSPDDQPDLVMATVEELTIILERNLSALEPTPPAESAGLAFDPDFLVETIVRQAVLAAINAGYENVTIGTQNMRDFIALAAAHVATQAAEIAALKSDPGPGAWVPAIQLVTADKRIARLRDALIRLRDCDWVISLPDRMDAVRSIARQALNPETDHD